MISTEKLHFHTKKKQIYSDYKSRVMLKSGKKLFPQICAKPQVKR